MGGLIRHVVVGPRRARRGSTADKPVGTLLARNTGMYQNKSSLPVLELFLHPPDGAMKVVVDVDHFEKPSIVLSRSELACPKASQGGRMPCPRCETPGHIIAKGWVEYGSRRGIMRNSSCDLMCYR